MRRSEVREGGRGMEGMGRERRGEKGSEGWKGVVEVILTKMKNGEVRCEVR